jgi:anti-sigma regulatory factor (Ser/Thr protein kinase)
VRGQALFGLSHEALLYRDVDEFTRVLKDFIAEAVEAGEPVLAALPAYNVEALLRSLGELVRGVQFEDMTIVGHNPGCVLELYQQWIDGHTGRVRVIGELVWPGRSYAELVECLRHEALVNCELDSRPATILCPFDATRLSSEALAGAELTHPSLMYGDGSQRPSKRYGEPDEVFAGERWPQESANSPVSELVFEGDLHALRESVAADPNVATLSPERRADLVFAVNEAATNAVRHGPGECTTRIWQDGANVVTEVNCESTLERPEAGRLRPDPGSLSGRGLWLVNQLCDLVELRSGAGGTSVRMHVGDVLRGGRVGSPVAY